MAIPEVLPETPDPASRVKKRLLLSTFGGSGIFGAIVIVDWLLKTAKFCMDKGLSVTELVECSWKWLL